MKKILLSITGFLMIVFSFAQEMQNDTLITPKKSPQQQWPTKSDTTKLKGGALIDTINTKDTRNKHKPTKEILDTVPHK
jgi:hypothetical protein